jgi:hypothetical protein
VRKNLEPQATRADLFHYFHDEEEAGALRAEEVFEGLRSA